MACSIAVKRHHEFEPYSPEQAIKEDNLIVPPSKKMRPCNFQPRLVGPSLNVNFDKMSLASSSKKFWSGISSSEPSLTPTKFASLPPKPDFKSARKPFEEASRKYKRTYSQIADLVHQEFGRLKRRKHLPEGDGTSEETILNQLASSPVKTEITEVGTSSNGSESPVSKKETINITLKQVCMICDRMLKAQEENLCNEFEQKLIEKLSEQYCSYVKFTQDQLQSSNIDHSESYIS